MRLEKNRILCLSCGSGLLIWTDNGINFYFCPHCNKETIIKVGAF